MDIRNIAMRGLVKIAAGRDWNLEYQKILNQERLDWANRSGDRGYVTRPVSSAKPMRPAATVAKAAPKARRAVTATASPATTVTKATPKARRTVNPAWRTFSGGMPGKRLTLPRKDPNLRRLQGGMSGKRIGLTM